MPHPAAFDELLRQLGEEHRREVLVLQQQIKRLAVQEDTHWTAACERSQSRGSRGFEREVPDDKPVSPSTPLTPLSPMGPKLQPKFNRPDFEVQESSHYLTAADLATLGRANTNSTDGRPTSPDEDALNAAFALATSVEEDMNEASPALLEESPVEKKHPAPWVEAARHTMTCQPDGDSDSLDMNSEVLDKDASSNIALMKSSDMSKLQRSSTVGSISASLNRLAMSVRSEVNRAAARPSISNASSSLFPNSSLALCEKREMANWRRLIRLCKNKKEDVIVELHETWMKPNNGYCDLEDDEFYDGSAYMSPTVTNQTNHGPSHHSGHSSRTTQIRFKSQMVHTGSHGSLKTRNYDKDDFARLANRWLKQFIVLPLLLLFSMMNPNSVRRICWDIMGMVLLAHDLIMFPMSVYNEGTSGMADWYKKFEESLIFAAAVFWSLDMLVAFRTGYYSNEGFVEMNQKKVAINYLKTWFCLDAAIVSCDWASFAIGLGSTSGYMRLGKTVSRTLRIFRLLRMIKVSHILKELMERINSEYILTVVGLLKIVVVIVIVNHYIACGWYALSQYWADDFEDKRWVIANLREKEVDDAGDGDSEDAPAAPPTTPSTGYAYFTSLHWSLTQFTPASMEVFPKNVYERSFNVVVIILALVVFSSFVSSITSAMTHLRQINARRTEQETKIRRFFSEHKVSHELAGRVWHFLRKNQIHSGRRIKEEDVPSLKLLPLRIREELRMEVFFPVLRTHPLFEIYLSLCPAAMRHICNQALTEVSCNAGQELYKDTKKIDKMTFLVFGNLEYHWSPNEEALHIKSPTWVAEVAIWAEKGRLTGPLVAAAGGCDFVWLDVDKFRSIVHANESGSALLIKYAELFVKRFNSCSQDDGYTNLLFNDTEIMQEIADCALQTVVAHQRQTFGRESIIRTLFGRQLASVHSSRISEATQL